MQIIGHGIDLVETARIAKMLEDHHDRFLERCFTRAERAVAEHIKADSRRIQYYAGRFAGKEAILKALGTGWRDGIAWTDAEILRDPSGGPRVAVHNLVAEIARERGIRHWHLSISHISTHATASAIAAGA